MSGLEITLLYLLAAVLGVVLCGSLKLPPMLGYLVVGVVIGPNALALAQSSSGIHHLAEFGVVFLMFVIGLEFNLHKLQAMRRHVLGLGSLQVVVTMVLTIAGTYLLDWMLPGDWKLRWQSMVALSGVMAMSSTAMVVKMMAERLELETEHGKRVMGILLFQDLAVVPLLVVIPALGSSTSEMIPALGWAFAKAALVLFVLLAVGPRLMQWWLHRVVRTQSNELFMLNLLLVTLGLAWLTELAGLSLALGAFVAGMLISETPYKHQVETDIRPFHDVLLGLFFITIGMMLDWHIVLGRWSMVLFMLVASLLLKTVVIAALTRMLGASTGVALRTGLYLTQAGEFGFVLLSLAQSRGLVDPELLNPILASMVLSMLATPFIITHSQALVMKLVANEWMMQSLQMTTIARKSIGANRHVVICGFGRCGQNLAKILEGEKIPYLALDLDPDRVTQAAAAGHAVVYGDAARLQALAAAGLSRASAVVVTYLNEHSAMRVLGLTRQHAPQVPVIVRTQDDLRLEELQHAGAAEVVPETLEGSLMLASHALALVGVPMRRVLRIVQEQRDARYNLLRGYFRGADDDTADELQHVRLATLILPPKVRAVGTVLEQLGLGELNVRVVSLRREDGKPVTLDGACTLQAGDTLVLSGRPDALALAEQRLLKT